MSPSWPMHSDLFLRCRYLWTLEYNTFLDCLQNTSKQRVSIVQDILAAPLQHQREVRVKFHLTYRTRGHSSTNELRI